MFINNPGHMTKMVAIPIYGKNPSKPDFKETWHVALSTRVLQCDDLDLFYDKVNIGGPLI